MLQHSEAQMSSSAFQKRHILPPAAFFGTSFFFHLLWENLQMPLYKGFTSLQQHFWICLRATATGDMLFMITLYLALAAVHRDWFWIADASTFRHPATWLITLLTGVLLAVSFELWAVHVAHRWQYGSMPLLPILQVGLTPVLQMIAIPSAVLLISYHLSLRL
jgi:hypothetical protein